MPVRHVRALTKRLVGMGRFVLRRLRERADREHEMSFNRLAFAVLITASLYVGGKAGAHTALDLMGTYIALALVILAHIVAFPAVSPVRRLCALLLDVTFLSWQLHLGGELSAAFFPIYLWIAFGNGFRFGLTWLRIAMLTTFLGFGVVVVTTPFWHDQAHLAVGLLASLVVLPAYAGTLISRLSKARQQAEHASEAKTLFLAGVSHELRTPLTAIIGMGGMLRASPLDLAQQEMAETVQTAATSLLSLITGILDFARIEAGHMPTDAEVFNLWHLLRETRGLVAAQAHLKGLTVALHIDASTPILVMCSRRNLSDILVNLLANAVKFTEHGVVVVAVQSIPSSQDACRLTIRVIDGGIGIGAEAQERIFESFTQADPTIRHRYGGTGLGLALARRRAELLGGTLTVSSVEGHGAEFVLNVDVGAPAQTVGHDDAARVSIVTGTCSRRRDAVAAQLAAGGATVISAVEASRRLARGDLGTAPLHRSSVLVVIDDPASPDFFPSSEVLALRSRLPGLPCIILPADGRTAFNHLAWPMTALLLSSKTPEDLKAATQTAHRHWPDRTLHDPDTEPAYPPSRRHLLVADDNLVNRRVLAKMLESGGHSVTTVENGELALDALEHSPGRFDLVFMDMNMPVMNGLEATKLYRFVAIGQPRLPIVGLTADASRQAAERCLEAGMDRCVTKPVTPPALLKLVAELTAPHDRAIVASGHGSPDHAGKPAVTRAVLNAGMLHTLEQLGGQEFLFQLVDDFLVEAHATAQSVLDASLQSDHVRFQAAAHALQSSAANIGAQSLADLCSGWQHLRIAEFAAYGRQLPTALMAEMTRTRDAFVELRSTLVY